MVDLVVVLPSILTVPAVKGGAVEVLLENFLRYNENVSHLNIVVIAHYVKDVEKAAAEFKYTKFKYINFPNLIMRGNSIINNVFHFGLPDLWERKVIRAVCEVECDKILFEGGRNIFFRIKENKPKAKIYYHTHADVKIIDNWKTINFFPIKKIITVSDYIHYRQLEKGIPSENVLTVTNGIDVKKFNMDDISKSDDEIRKIFKLPKGKIVLFKGRLVKEKGVLELCEAFKRLNDKEALLVLAGSKNFGDKRRLLTPYEKKIKDYVDGNKRIIQLGYVDYSEIPLLHKIARCIVVPSIWNEPCGLVVIEALVSCVPLIATATGGTPELVSGTSAVLLENDSDMVENLTERLRELLSNDCLCQEISDSERQKINYFSNERYCKDLLQALDF